MIIGISGKIGSGKDTVATLLQAHQYNLRFPFPVSKEEVLSYLDDPTACHYLDKMGEADDQMWKQVLLAKKLKQFVADILGVPVEKLNEQDFKKSDLPVEWNVIVPEQFNTKRKMTVRELLIAIGDGMRERVHPDIWVNALFSQYTSEKLKWIIPDVRYPNEVNRIQKLAGTMIRVNRPGIEMIDHISETGLDNYDRFDFVIENDSDLSSLFDKTKTLLNDINERFTNRMVTAK
jgi:hypothetical protein